MRLIDADALAKRLNIKESCAECEYEHGGFCKKHGNFVDACEAIFDAPTIHLEPHWIPVTERLPEVKQRVIVQYADGSMAIKRCIDAGHLRWFYARTVAWMPCPEPYKGD